MIELASRGTNRGLGRQACGQEGQQVPEPPGVPGEGGRWSVIAGPLAVTSGVQGKRSQ